jgi:hypothetical protein
MKIRHSILATFIFIAATLNAQTSPDEKAFKKGDFIINLGANLGGYATSWHREYDYQYWDGTSIQTAHAEEDADDGAVSVILPLQLEYGLTNWLGVGAGFSFNKYLGKDSTLDITPKVNSYDIDGVVNLHFIKSRHFDMPLCINVGYSIFSYKTLDSLSSMAKDNGINFTLGLNPRIYFGDHLGMHFDLKYASYIYPSVTFSNENDPDLNSENNESFSLKGKGLNFGLGFQYKF